jgi:hypothetical protein
MSKVGLTTLKVGDKVKVVANTSGHGLAVGTLTTLTTGFSGGYYRVNNSTSVFYPADLEHVDIFTRETVEANIAELKAKIAVEEAKFSFLDETGKTEGNETEMKVYATLQLLESPDLSRLAKTEAIALLLQQ